MKQAHGYRVFDYGRMVECEPRMSIYAEALRRAVMPGCTVIDLGAAFGVFALLACKYGAGHVIAIEPDPSIELLMPMAKANGCADRITVVRDISLNYQPETRADVIVSDCRGTVPLYQHHIETIADARARLLAPQGTLLPMRDTLRIALARWPKNHRANTRPWQRNSFGLDLGAGYNHAVNSEIKAFLKPDALSSAPQDLAVIDYRTITDPNLDASVELAATRSGAVHGLLVWFDAEIADGLGYSNAPGQPELVYGQMFLPFAGGPKLAVGERIGARLRGTLVDNHYVWTWDWQVVDQGGQPRGALVRQSSSLSQVFSPRALARSSNRHVPEPTPEMMLNRDCLALVDGKRSLEDIAKALADRHEGFFASGKDALRHVATLLEPYR